MSDVPDIFDEVYAQLQEDEDTEDDPPSPSPSPSPSPIASPLPLFHEHEESEELEPDIEIPSLDDIIPWTPIIKPPPLVEVLECVHSVRSVNVDFLRNVLRSHFAKDGVLHEVTVESHTQASMDTPNQPERNCLLKVDVNATIDGRPETFNMVIKTLSPSQPVRMLSAGSLFDRREVGMYTQILDDLNVFQRQQLPNANEYILVPSSKCFFARYVAPCVEMNLGGYQDMQNPESVVVLENVKCKGFTQTLIHEGLSRQQVLAVFEGVSRLHGLSLAMKERSGIPLQRSYPYLICISEVTANLVRLFDKNMRKIGRILHVFGAERILYKLMALRPHLMELTESLLRPDEPISVLSHMNLWAHNILFKDKECVFVDWQMITIARPTLDLAFLLATSVRPNIRRRYIELFLRYYYFHFTIYAQRYGLNIKRDLGYTMRHLRKDFCLSQLVALLFYIAKSDTLITTRENELCLVDYLYDLEQQGLINVNILSMEAPQYFYWRPSSPPRENPVYRTDRRSSDEDPDHICGLFPVYELPEE